MGIPVFTASLSWFSGVLLSPHPLVPVQEGQVFERDIPMNRLWSVGRGQRSFQALTVPR